MTYDVISGSGLVNEMHDLIAAVTPVVNAMLQLGVPHYVGGSVASSFHGAARSTMDVDLVCELSEDDVSSLMRAIGNEYYASESAAIEAVRRQGCFNLIHLPTSFKVDVFVSRRRPFDLEAMQRAEVQRIAVEPRTEFAIATPEDVIVSKLEWYRLNDETSERQWDDVSRLIDLLAGDLDRTYLERAAQSVGVSDLLAPVLRGR